MASQDGSRLTIIIEKMQGQCVYCQEEAYTKAEQISIRIATGGSTYVGAGHSGAWASLQHWVTNKSTWFHRERDLVLLREHSTGNLVATVTIHEDSIVTLTTVTTATRGMFPEAVPVCFTWSDRAQTACSGKHEERRISPVH